MSALAPEHQAVPAEHALSPVPLFAVGAMGCVITGGIVVAAYLPREAPTAVPLVFLGLAIVLLLAMALSLVRLRNFAWSKFFLVSGWALFAYVVISGMLELVFVLDGTPTNQLLLLTAMLVIFALDIPVLFGFSVARHQPA
ncbi:MAG: hypothetical protein ACRDGF_03700 [Chloroflexota bacterium]